MDRLVALFEQLELPEIAELLRAAVYAAVALGVVALVVLSLVGYPLAGLGAVVGLGLGLANVRLVMSKVAKLNRSGRPRVRKALVSNTAARLGLTTVVVLGLAVADVPLGFGALAGVAAFYLLFVASFLRALLRRGVRA